MRAHRFARVMGASSLLVVGLAGPGWACGGLVGENGTVQLVKTTTLAAFHNGVQRYVTSFEFTGSGENLGSIVPLPGVPSAVERGGDWTLQRLGREVAPPQRDEALESSGALRAAAGAQVLLETKIDALDITVLEGGGDEVGEWAISNGFVLTPDAPEVLDFYARRSPIFMAAKFDASRAAALGQGRGDGTPIMLTIPVDEPWVPLRILTLGLDSARVIEADVFVLTDEKPQLLVGGKGVTLARNERASSGLLRDLRSDKGMEWVPADMWLSYLKVSSPAAELDYDLAISTRQGQKPLARAAGLELGDHAVVVANGRPASLVPWAFAATLAIVAAIAVGAARRANRLA